MSGVGELGSETTSLWPQNDTRIPIEQALIVNSIPAAFGSAFGVDEALKAAHIHEATGWILKDPSSVCDAFDYIPSLTICPTVGGGGGPLRAPAWPWQMKVVPDCSCCKCCSPREKGWRTYSVQEGGGVELISFRYRPHLWYWSGCPKQRPVDIFIPQRTERIGCMEMAGNFEEGTKITDCITGSVYVVSQIKQEKTTMALFISDNFRNPLVICHGISGERGEEGGMDWQEYAMELLPAMANSTLSNRAVLLVACQMWILVNKENSSRAGITFMAVVLLWIIAILFFGVYLKLF